MKRARANSSDILTGGTGDVNPQLLSDSITMSAADTTTSQQIVLPIQRIAANAPNHAIVMELLKVFVAYPSFGAIANVAEVTETQALLFTTRNFDTTAVNFSDPSVFAAFFRTRQAAFTAGGTYDTEERAIESFDLTDGDGHGILIATDSIFCQGRSANVGTALTYRWKLLYRWKRVSLPEYIGIVQSQQ